MIAHPLARGVASFLSHLLVRAVGHPTPRCVHCNSFSLACADDSSCCPIGRWDPHCGVRVTTAATPLDERELQSWRYLRDDCGAYAVPMLPRERRLFAAYEALLERLKPERVPTGSDGHFVQSLMHEPRYECGCVIALGCGCNDPL